MRNGSSRGATGLKKHYFETYRLPEDLDFAVTDPSHFDREFPSRVFRVIGHWLYERTGIEIPQDLLVFDLFKNPRGTMFCQGKLSYRGPIAPRSIWDCPGIKPVLQPYMGTITTQFSVIYENLTKIVKRTGAKNGGPGGIRTLDLLHAMEARSQLRHRPTQGFAYIVARDFGDDRPPVSGL